MLERGRVISAIRAWKASEVMTTLEQIFAEARHLSTHDKLRLIERLALDLEHTISSGPVATAERRSRSLHGALADLGPAPSEEDIKEMRRIAWGNFPREVE
jgi:hypothetical protein